MRRGIKRQKRLVLQVWTNSRYSTEPELERLGNKILKVRKQGGGHLITYRHPTLTKKPQKGDLVEYVDYDGWKRRRRKAIVNGTGRDWYCPKDHIDVKDSIVPIGSVTKIVKEGVIPRKLWRYL